MRHFAIALVLMGVHAVPAHGQNRSYWGVVAGFVPRWETPSSVEKLATLVFSEDDVDLLKGREFRIGLARGGALSGDWGVSFIRKTFDEQNPTTVEEGSGCQGGSVPGGQLILNCETSSVVLTPDKLRISGVEASKFIAFATIARRVQIGLNVGGGIGILQGRFTTSSFDTRFTCTLPAGGFPGFSFDDPCKGGTRGPATVTPTGTGTEPATRILNSSSNLIPLGKVEVAASVIITPRIKVRIGGGLNYPGTNIVGVTGIYFFGED